MESAEILSTHSAPATPRLATVKSKVTNGRRVFAVGGDGRGAWTRRWKDIVELHVSDAGGRDHMTEAMLSLCRRAATLEIQLEQLECCMSQGDDATRSKRRLLASPRLRGAADALAALTRADRPCY
jgi:hypothetical protein